MMARVYVPLASSSSGKASVFKLFSDSFLPTQQAKQQTAENRESDAAARIFSIRKGKQSARVVRDDSSVT